MRIVRGVGIAFLILVVVLVVNALGYRSQQVQVEAAAPIEVDSAAAAERLGAALRLRTISRQKQSDFDAAPFRALHAFFAQRFPLTHERLDREFVAGHSLLYFWPGSDPTLQPVVLMAHQDVVPVEPGTESSWRHPAFAGEIAEGFVWGRGAIDNKGTLMAQLEAVEWLLRSGFEPVRGIYLAFGHDEERGGPLGAHGIAALLAERGVHALFTLDEGGAIGDGLIPGLDSGVAMVALAEKGYVTLSLTARADGGHSSNPPPLTAVGALSRAVAALEANQMPAELAGPVAAMVDALGREMNFGLKMVLANQWLFGPVVRAVMERQPRTNSFVRTTTAPTVLHAGMKENVLPSEATALVNFRILPGDSVASVLEHARRAVADPAISIEVHTDHAAWEPSPVASLDSESFEILSRTIREVFPETIVVPSLVPGGTDSKHFIDVAENNYRFAPIRMGRDDMQRFHGTNERVSVDFHASAIRFFVRLIENVAG